MSTDNPSPEMIQARKEVLDRHKAAHKAAADAWKEIHDAYGAIGKSTAQLGSKEIEALYRNLSDAQNQFKIAYDEYENAHEAAGEYFQPIQSGTTGLN